MDKKKILLVDDDEIQILAFENILKEKFEIITAKSGKKALKIVYGGVKPDLILLDILMPDMDGWEVFNRLKGISLIKDVPIAFLTAVHGAKEKKLAYDIGAADFIVKPFQADVLIERIDTILKDYKSKDQSVDYYVISQ